MHNAWVAKHETRESEDEKERRAARLRQARHECHLAGPAEAADEFGWNYSTYAAHENGTRGFGHKAREYAVAFGVRWEWLLNEDGPMKEGEKDEWQATLRRIPMDMRAKLLPLLKQFIPDEEK